MIGPAAHLPAAVGSGQSLRSLYQNLRWGELMLDGRHFDWVVSQPVILYTLVHSFASVALLRNQAYRSASTTDISVLQQVQRFIIRFRAFAMGQYRAS